MNFYLFFLFIFVQMMQTSADPSSLQYGSMIPQLTTHMSTLQLSTGGSVSFIL